jgi:hypothetical protein
MSPLTSRHAWNARSRNWLKAAAWARKELPGWAGLIGEAITWRQHQWEVPQADGAATVPVVRRFIAEIADRVAASTE